MAKRFIAEALGRGNQRQAVGLIRLTLVLRFVAGILIALGIIFSFSLWPSLSGAADHRILIIIVAITILPHGLNYAFISIFRGFQKYEYAAYVTLFTAPLRLILIFTLLLTGSGLQEVLIVQVGSFCLGTVVGLYFLRRLISLKDLFIPKLMESFERKQALRYAVTLIGISFVAYLAQNQLSTFFIEIYCPVEQVGFFRLAGRMVALPMTLAPTALGFVLTPAVAEQFGKGNMDRINKIYITSARYLMMVALPLEMGMIALASPIIALLYGPDYASVVLLMRIVLIPSAMAGIGHAAGAVVFGTNRPGYIFKMNFIFSFVTVGLNLLLIPIWGVLGAALTSLIPAFGMAIFVIRFASKQIGASWPVSDTIKIISASVIMGLIVFLLQNQLSPILSLVLGIPAGIVLYFTLLLLFKVIDQSDLLILKNVQSSIPKPLKKSYIRFVDLAEKVTMKRKPAENEEASIQCMESDHNISEKQESRR
jgi:O-antigen/teichoic acid export membrane protein